jgi:hypothetical protein
MPRINVVAKAMAQMRQSLSSALTDSPYEGGGRADTSCVALHLGQLSFSMGARIPKSGAPGLRTCAS